ncbi:MAG: hypothetical protein JXB47_12455 [Anaerolineae bacterium]|nr:hypothetical protein [Anaerolineae bacterium]
MRAFTNQDKLRRNRRLAQVTFVVALVVLGSSFAITFIMTPEQQLEYYWLSFIILPVGLVAAIASVRLTNQWMRPPHPEEVLDEALKKLGNNYTLYHYYLPAHHVLVGARGVFTISTRFQTGSFTVKGGRWGAQGGCLARVVRFFRQEGVGAPTLDAQQDATRVQVWLDRVVPDSGVEVEPLVVFIAPGVEVEVEDPAVPVLYADSNREPNLFQYITEAVKDKERPGLTKEQRGAVETATLQTGK